MQPDQPSHQQVLDATAEVEATLVNGQLAIRVLRGECTALLSITPQGL